MQRLVLVENNDDLPIMKQRQRTAFPPNYIHSIDSSHMMLTAIACRDEGARTQPAGRSVIAPMYRHDANHRRAHHSIWMGQTV